MASSALSREGAIATLKIDRAEKMNALDRATLLELREHVADLARQPAAVVVVESAGDKVFVAGADIEAISGVREMGEAAECVDSGRVGDHVLPRALVAGAAHRGDEQDGEAQAADAVAAGREGEDQAEAGHHVEVAGD